MLKSHQSADKGPVNAAIATSQLKILTPFPKFIAYTCWRTTVAFVDVPASPRQSRVGAAGNRREGSSIGHQKTIANEKTPVK
jgi:hypothetical protein